MSDHFSPSLLAFLLSLVFISTIVTGTRRCLIVAWMGIFWMANDAARLCICVFVICVSSLMKCRRTYFTQLLIDWFSFSCCWWWVFRVLYFRYKSFIRYVINKYFLPISNLCSYTFNRVYCWVKVFEFDEVQLIDFFSFMHHAFGFLKRTPRIILGPEESSIFF